MFNGVELAPAEKTIAGGKKIVDFRAEDTAPPLLMVFGRKSENGGRPATNIHISIGCPRRPC